jgi:Tol biopolymer transport system component
MVAERELRVRRERVVVREKVQRGRVLGIVAVLALTLGFSMLEPQSRDTARATQSPIIPVTVEEGTNIAVTMSGDGRSMVMDLDGFLYKLPAAGGRADRLTDVLLDPARPHYAPDGSQIAVQTYDSDAGGYFHISTVTADGDEIRQLTEGEYDHREPRWSRDGTRVAFSSDRPDGVREEPPDVAGSYNIWSIDVNTGELQQWTDTPTEEEFEPTWSPDGSEVAFVVDDSIQAVDEAGNRRTLVPQRPDVTLNSPSWSPDGEEIAYVAQSEGESNLMVSGRQVTSGQDVFVYSTPEWISENEILYAADGKIRILNVDTAVFRTVPFSATLELPELSYEKKSYDFDSRRPRLVQGIVTPTLSPNGRTVAFTALNDLWVMEIGRKPRRITNDTYYEVESAWSRDGRYLAYSSDREGTQDIYVRDMRTGEERRVTALEDQAEIAPAWSPDGRTIAFQNNDYATFTVDVNSGGIRQVIDPLFAPGRPTWSADGNTIALAARRRYSTRFREGHNQILTVNLTTGEQAYHPPGEQFDSISTRADDGPVWSPDGRWMAFVVESTLRIMPVDQAGQPTGPVQQITDEATDAISWSGDSEWLLYLNNGSLKMVRRDGSETRAVPLRLTYRPAQSTGRTVIHAGRLWDGTSPEVEENVDIVVVNDRIKSISPHRRPIRGPHVDASDLTVIPGLWDAHFHREREIRFFADRTGRAALAYGLTSTLAPGDAAYRSVENREATMAGTRVGPRGFASGEAIDGTRTHLNYFRPVTSLEQMTLELSRVRELDYDYLKTYVRPPADIMAAATEAAHGLGIPVGTHLMAPGFYVGQDVTTHLGATQRLGYARTMSETAASYADVPEVYAKRSVNTTIGGNEFLWSHDCETDPRARLFPPWKTADCGPQPDPDPECLTGTCRQAHTFARIREAGGLVVAGTDFPLGDDLPFNLHAELRALVLYGWTPYEALVAATRNAARFIGVQDDLGTLEPGKLADMVFVTGNPLEHIEDAINVEMVMQNGALFTPEEILEGFFGKTMAKAGVRSEVSARPTHHWLAPVPDHPSNKAFWWHQPKYVRQDYRMTES